MITIGKLALKCAQENRAHNAILIKRIDVATDCVMAKGARAGLDGFLKAAKDKGRDEIEKTLGTAEVEVFNGLVVAAEQFLKEAGNKTALEALGQFNVQFKEMKLKDKLKHFMTQVLHTKISQPFNKKLRTIELHLTGDCHGLYEVVVLPALKEMKGLHQYMGQAPRGNLERQVQSIVDELSTGV